jgi:Sulfotransferase family
VRSYDGQPSRLSYHAHVASPILVTGSHRSGTTWVGRMLGVAPGVGYLHEPLSPRRWPGWLRRPPPYWFLHISRDNEHEYAGLIRDLFAFRYPWANVLRVRHPRQAFQIAEEVPFGLWYRLQGARPLLKDPIALMSTEWLAERFGAQPVVMLRHPAAFAASLLGLDWPRFDFANWRDQPLLLRGLLAPYERDIEAFADRPGDLIDETILLWNAIHHVIGVFQERHPDWAFVRHEDLSEEPVKGFRDLYDRLGLTWDPVAEAVILRASTGPEDVPPHLHRTVRRDSRAARWTWARRLSPNQAARVREGTAQVASAWYGDEDWTPSAR